MLGFYEKRHFSDAENIWLGRYENLTNVLHWHYACEIIRIAEGTASIKIGEQCYSAVAGDCFFCAGEQLHYIISDADAQIDIAIFSENLLPQITEKYILCDAKLSSSIATAAGLQAIRQELAEKGRFYRQAAENLASQLLIDIFRNSETKKRDKTDSLLKPLITKITEEFAYITFDEAVRYCGYSPSHFSKLFKKVTGMNFSDYLNILKVENAIVLLQERKHTITAICQKCGFSTLRNFNRVFRKITGYSPRSLPKDFAIERDLQISGAEHFDPTKKTSVLIK